MVWFCSLLLLLFIFYLICMSTCFLSLCRLRHYCSDNVEQDVLTKKIYSPTHFTHSKSLSPFWLKPRPKKHTSVHCPWSTVCKIEYIGMLHWFHGLAAFFCGLSLQSPETGFLEPSHFSYWLIDVWMRREEQSRSALQLQCRPFGLCIWIASPYHMTVSHDLPVNQTSSRLNKGDFTHCSFRLSLLRWWCFLFLWIYMFCCCRCKLSVISYLYVTILEFACQHILPVTLRTKKSKHLIKNNILYILVVFLLFLLLLVVVVFAVVKNT